MMKKVLIGALVALVIGLALMAWQQHLRVQEAREQAAALQVEVDSAQAAIRRAELETLEHMRVADSLQAAKASLEAEAAQREEVLEQRADSLQTAITDLVPEGEIREAVTAAVTKLRTDYETRLADKDGLLRLSDETVASLRADVANWAAVNARKDALLEIKDRQIAVWQEAANPDFFARIKSNSGLLAGTAAVAGLATLILGG